MLFGNNNSDLAYSIPPVIVSTPDLCYEYTLNENQELQRHVVPLFVEHYQGPRRSCRSRQFTGKRAMNERGYYFEEEEEENNEVMDVVGGGVEEEGEWISYIEHILGPIRTMRYGAEYQAQVPKKMPRKHDYNQESQLIGSLIRESGDLEVAVVAPRQRHHMSPYSLSPVTYLPWRLNTVESSRGMGDGTMGVGVRFNDRWLPQEESAFELGMHEMHERNFEKMRKFYLPYRSTQQLVSYYYNVWKVDRYMERIGKEFYPLQNGKWYPQISQATYPDEFETDEIVQKEQVQQEGPAYDMHGYENRGEIEQELPSSPEQIEVESSEDFELQHQQLQKEFFVYEQEQLQQQKLLKSQQQQQLQQQISQQYQNNGYQIDRSRDFGYWADFDRGNNYGFETVQFQYYNEKGPSGSSDETALKQNGPIMANLHQQKQYQSDSQYKYFSKIHQEQQQQDKQQEIVREDKIDIDNNGICNDADLNDYCSSDSWDVTISD
eukprot:TRINITY_DN21517_c0_g1_i1.p1 TRINITY_DN21517_c0_g1~~TRINITY_DN21517_c0_g1_i1.p1  ORF type:complete len:563 (+),score=99.82 TRINITY_DN21517_c0_g1_i1:215-1690(+)